MVTTGTIHTLPITGDNVARQPLQADKCALVVIDIQEKLLPPIFNKDELVKNSQLLIRLAGILGIPTLVTTQYARGLGQIVPEITSLLPAGEHMDKVEFSCFGSERFCSAVKSLPGNRSTMLVCGMEAHICVMQTVLAGLDSGYLVHVPADAVGSRTKMNWKLGLGRMHDAGAVISSTEMAMYELLRASGTPAFKQMLPYIKG
ncbi:MAG TPA: hydrolase [Terriglobales bacterium]|nr:hydrolase [Terriglobales bacterium]